MSQHKKNRHKQRISDDLLPLKIVGYSIACERHPLRNEDSYFIEENSGLAAVFDGVGGSAAGEVASQTAKHATLHGWKQALRQIYKRQRGRLVDCHATDFCAVLRQLIEETKEFYLA